MKMKNVTKTKNAMSVWIVTALLAVVFFAGCDNGTNCDCPVKIHGNSPCDCGSSGCDCEPQFYQLSHNITLKNDTGIKDIDDKIILIENTLTWMETNDAAVLTVVEGRNVEMVLVNGSTLTPERNSVTIGYDNITESSATNNVSAVLADLADMS
jgi:hypothetical protein